MVKLITLQEVYINIVYLWQNSICVSWSVDKEQIRDIFTARFFIYVGTNMLLKDIFAVFMIPSIVSPENNSSLVKNSDSVEFEDIWTNFPNIFNNSGGRKLFGGSSANGDVDQLLVQVNDDIQKLHLDYPDDYFDHLEDKSEEVRELIRRRKQSVQTTKSVDVDVVTSAESLAPDAPSRSTPLSDEEEGGQTEFPILILPSPIDATTTAATTTTTKKPSIISEVKNEASSFFGKIVSPISVSSVNIYAT